MRNQLLTRAFFFFLIFLGSMAGGGFSQTRQFFTLSNVKARPLAMGGAFTSIEDDLPAIGFNPAAFFLYENKKSKRITLFLNPVASVVGAVENSELFSGKGSKIDDVFLALGLLVKSISISIGSFDFGLLLSEQTLRLPDFKNEIFFDVSGLRQNYSHTFVGSLKLAKQVSLGGSLNFVSGSTNTDPRERDTGVGFSYGILLRPEKGLKIGVSFVNLPDSLKSAKLPFERIVDESVNVGVSYQLFKGTLLSVDVRNLGEEAKTTVREIHLGFEQVLLSHVAIRTGYFRSKEGTDVFSWGLGLFDENTLFASENSFSHRNFLLNYAYVYENTPVKSYSHFLSLLVRI